jgi:hypothetical protein
MAKAVNIKVSDLLAAIEALPPLGIVTHSHVWTQEEDAALLRGRERRARWDDICKVIGICENVARARYRELINAKE